MPKLKTRKAIRKRFKVTKTGKVLGSHTKRRHLLGDRPASKKRRNRRQRLWETFNRKVVLRSLPYG